MTDDDKPHEYIPHEWRDIAVGTGFIGYDDILAERNNLAEAVREVNARLVEVTAERDAARQSRKRAVLVAQRYRERAWMALTMRNEEREILIAKIAGLLNESAEGLDEWLEAKRLVDEVKQFADQVKPYIADMERKVHAAATLAASNAVASEYWRDQYRALKEEKRGASDAQVMQAAARSLAEEVKEWRERAQKGDEKLVKTTQSLIDARYAASDARKAAAAWKEKAKQLREQRDYARARVGEVDLIAIYDQMREDDGR